MVAVSFSVFKDKLLSSEKDQTIRPFSEYRYRQLSKPNCKLQIYWKQRTKECEKLFEAVVTELFVIQLDPDERVIYHHEEKPMTEEELEEVVRRDGFASVEEFFEFFVSRYGKEHLRENPFILLRFERLASDSTRATRSHPTPR